MRPSPRPPAGLAIALAAVFAVSAIIEARAQSAGAPYPVPRFRHVDPLAKAPELPGQQVIRFLADEDFPPFSYRDSSGALTGYSIAMANALCEELKLTCQFAARPFSALPAALERGEADVLVAGFRLDAALLEKAEFTKPYYRSLARFVVLRDDPLARADGRSLAGKRIGVLAGTAHEAWLAENFSRSTMRSFPSMDEAARALGAREIDALFGEAAALVFWTNAVASDDCCRLTDGAFIAADSLSPGMSLLVRHGNRRLVDALDHGLDRLETTGVQAVVFRRFFPASPW